MQNEKLRNVAIIAHVDHGKTTLVDEMLKQGGAYRENQETVDRVMDSGDLERERGITILAKNTAIQYKDTKINVVDTPGHADFGGEVERILKMVNGVILLVDAAEGPMPQTRFVLSRALELGHRVIVVVNKIDRPDQRIHEVVDEVLELLMDLDATPEQLDSPMLFCSGRNGTASYSPETVGTDLTPLFETILEYIPAPEANVDEPFQMLVSAIDYNDFVGRIAIGRIERGALKQNQEIVVCNYHAPDAAPKKAKATAIYEFDGLAKKTVTESTAGNIIAMSGIGDITIGDTICAPSAVEALPFVKISAPTLEMTFSVNDSPFAGREGKFVTSRQIRERLYRETLKDVSLRVTDTDRETAFNVAGRGEMSLSILIETMRREGYEFQVSPARVLYKEIDGVKCEPIERLVVDVPGDCVGSVIEKLGQRKADMLEMTPVGDRMKIEFLIPARGLFGYRNEFLTDTKGEGIMASVFDSYAPYKGEISRRGNGSMISFETGESITYGLYNAQERGTLFIGAGVPVYGGMIIGVNPRSEDMTVNICKKKQLTNTRASGSDDALRLIPAPEANVDEPFQMLVSAIDYNDFVGRIAIGRIERGALKQNQEIVVCNYHAPDAAPKKAKATAIYEFDGLAKKTVTESTAGNIIAMSGIGDITIGDTICAPSAVEALPFVKISAPTLEMTFSVNDSPFAGREGKFVTSRQIRERLYRETLKDVSLRVTDTDRETAFNVAGRGEMSLSILIETMRREGYEFQVSPARVLYKEIDGVKCEPIERLVVDVPGDCVGSVIEKLGQRKADMLEMTPVGDRMKIEFLIPARGLFGYRNEFLTDTKGEGIMASVFDSYAPYKGEISRRGNGSMISFETGESITYGLYNAQERGTLFIGAGVPVYGGMIIGVNPRSEDMTVNICKKKQLTNTRASGSDDALRLTPPRQRSLEQCLEFLADDELLEVTPQEPADAQGHFGSRKAHEGAPRQEVKNQASGLTARALFLQQKFS